MFQVKCKTFTFIRFCIVHPETFGASWNNVVWLIPRPLQTNIFIGYLFSVEPLIQWTPNETFLLQLCLMWAKTFVWLLKPLGPQAIFHVSDRSTVLVFPQWDCYMDKHLLFYSLWPDWNSVDFEPRSCGMTVFSQVHTEQHCAPCECSDRKCWRAANLERLLHAAHFYLKQFFVAVLLLSLSDKQN